MSETRFRQDSPNELGAEAVETAYITVRGYEKGVAKTPALSSYVKALPRTDNDHHFFLRR